VNNGRPGGCVPSDWIFFLGGLIAISTAVLLSGFLRPALVAMRAGNILDLFWIALGLAALGSICLFFARLPLYRQRKFFAFGPGALPPLHRKFYWLAYALVIVATLLLGVVWWRIR